MSFMENLKNEMVNNESSRTENGALGYKSTGKFLLDINFMVSSLRNAHEEKIVRKFQKAFFEDKLLAVKWLFYVRDVREGLGERRLFREGFKYICGYNPKIALELIDLIPFYGRWDDLFSLMNVNELVDNKILTLVKNQINNDYKDAKESKPISLLSKWMPNPTSSNYKTRMVANKITKFMEVTPKTYRKVRSFLNNYLDVTEVKMSDRRFNEINYSNVPSKANIRYKGAFMRNDEVRRTEFLEKLQSGDKSVKINSSTLYPHDIVNSYMDSECYCTKNYDISLEEMWKALPNTLEENKMIVVADGSGSMLCTVGDTKITALSISTALAIYCAEKLDGEYKNKYITFSERPQYVDFSNCSSLRDKIAKAMLHNEVTNTNIKAVFDLILNTAINKGMTNEELPKSILIISDMEFDEGASHSSEKLFIQIKKNYEEKGYRIPRLVFWNVNSRTNTVPLKENENGVVLLSGFSPNTLKMVMSNELDPYKCLLEVINSERYKEIDERVKNKLD